MTEKNLENISVVTSPLGTKTCLFVLTFLLCSEELSPHLKYDVKSPDLLYRFTFQYVPTYYVWFSVGDGLDDVRIMLEISYCLPSSLKNQSKCLVCKKI